MLYVVQRQARQINSFVNSFVFLTGIWGIHSTDDWRCVVCKRKTDTHQQEKHKKMKTLIIINDAPYGTEKAFNALRIANQLNKDFPEKEVTIFLMADGVNCAIPNQNTPNGYYNIERMIKLSTHKGTRLLLCGSCLEARGLKNIQLVEKSEISTMAELTKLIVECDKILTF